MLEGYEHLTVRVEGTAPLLMHSTTALDPLHPISKEMSLLTSKPAKEKKLESNIVAIQKLEWQAGMYRGEIDGKSRPVIPQEVIVGCIRDGAKQSRMGKEIQRSVLMEEQHVAVEYSGPTDLEGMWNADRFRDTRPVVVGRAKVMRTRPIFTDWSLTFSLWFDAEFVSPDTMRNIITTSGNRVGIGDYRPRFGRFRVVSFNGEEQQQAA